MKRLCNSRPKTQFQKSCLISLDFAVSLMGEMEVAVHDTVKRGTFGFNSLGRKFKFP
jgi:hypothetical protein